MLSREGKQTDRGAVGAEFIGYNRRRREALLLQEFPHQPNCRPSVPAGLNQEIQDFALTVHGTPEIELPPSNYDDHLVQVPAFGRSWPPTLNPPRIGPTEFQDPSSNCLIRDVETTLGKQVLNVPIAQRETAIEPDGMLDDDRWKAVTTVGYLAHPETLKHRPCRSHAVNVTMPLRQFGYDAFRNRTRRRTPTTGAIYDSYRLGVGDEIIVILHGKNWQNIRIQIDRSGRIILPQLRPIVAAGRTLGEFRVALRSDVKRTMLGTEVYVSIGKLRTVDVTVIGEVKLPGVYHLTGLSTLMDALIRAGGPNKSGSLRQIRINRGEKVRTIDLYDLFIQGGFRQDITLREGDRVLVPTIGPTIALAGHFKRPGIYELPPGAAPLLQSVVGYAGSPIRPRGNRFIRITVGKDGREEIREFRRLGSLRAGDGDVVIVQPGANIQIGGVWLEGEVRVPGRRSLGAARSVRQLIRDVKTLGKDAYLPFAVIRRLDAGTQAPIYLPVNLLDVLANRQDTLLRSADSFIVFHRTDIEFLGSADVQAVLNQAAPPSIGLASPGQEKRSFEDLDGDEDLDREKADADRVGRAVGATQVGSAKRADRSADGARRRSGLVREKSDKTLVRTDYACAGLRTLSVLIHNGSSARFANARRGIVTRRSSQVVNIVPCPTIFDRYPDLLAGVGLVWQT